MLSLLTPRTLSSFFFNWVLLTQNAFIKRIQIKTNSSMLTLMKWSRNLPTLKCLKTSPISYHNKTPKTYSSQFFHFKEDNPVIVDDGLTPSSDNSVYLQARQCLPSHTCLDSGNSYGLHGATAKHAWSASLLNDTLF